MQGFDLEKRYLFEQEQIDKHVINTELYPIYLSPFIKNTNYQFVFAKYLEFRN